MGIKGLHRELNFTATKCNITCFKDQVVAVDASSWLHKSAYCCAEGLNEPNGVEKYKAKYTSSFVDRCYRLLAWAQIRKIILVFDGKRCPLKADTNKERAQIKAANLTEARRLKAAGRHKEAEIKFR